MVSRSACFSAAVSVICGVIVFLLFRYFTPQESQMVGEGFAVLVFSDSEDDRLIREILAKEGIENVISESALSVPIDDFGAIREVQLDTFHDEIKYFDPRDTGYAAKLSSFFVHDGKRFFFIPLEEIAENRTVNVKNRLDAILYGIPFSLAVWGQEKPFYLYFTLLALGSAFTLFFSSARRHFSYQLPVLVAMGWGGFTATVLAALLCGIWELLREPLRELSVTRHSERRVLNYAGAGFMGIVERFKPFRINLFLVMLFLFFILVLFITGDLSFVPMLAGCLGFFFLNFVSFQVEKDRARKNRHIPFTPVLLFPLQSRTFSLFPFLLPFAAASLLVISLPLIFPGISPPAENAALIDSRYYVTAEDYHRHMAFQRSFSFRSLNHPQNEEVISPFYRDGYLRYYLGDDGLIVSSSNPTGSIAENPPFPLEKLKEFLVNYDSQTVAQTANYFMNTVEWVSVIIILTACIIGIIRPRILPKKKIPVFGDKRIAA